MLPVKEAELIILNLADQASGLSDVESVSLPEAAGRILATAVTSDLNFPHWDNSAMDGYAVRYEDVSGAEEHQPALLQLVAEIGAGTQPHVSIKAGQAARILTGAMMPEGADTVIIQEVTKIENNQVVILKAPTSQGEFVRYGGQYYKAGEPLLDAGVVLNAPEIAVLAAVGCHQIPVYRQPKVAILSTGNELVTPEKTLSSGQIFDSNQYALVAAVKNAGGVPVPLGIVKDDPEALKLAISQALETADIVLSTGGVSVGDYDYVEEILSRLRGRIHISSVAVKPGKPLTVATFSKPETAQQVLYFGLPGNPVSTLVTFWRFVQPAIKKIAGLSNNFEPIFLPAITRQDLRSDGKRESYLWGKLIPVKQGFEFELAGGTHASANLINLALTNSLAVVPVGEKLIPAGAEVQVMQIGNG
ncbi:molybdopterin molybdotransferase MoeA [Ancylothrix sp. C2]|uniref:molybdopterin molybdotransferase MoeA n=1 Tax=Ancylothrix sp. D3o TaxID=2953691 RepID=UPI0021BAC482|nr:gephyrin-like molybdotransferase Glp [Ancylothrix sp. D3o]MCT7951799.1 molybdopterin molybdotransferase MoeA [Ancylothrix sp. D3o]